LFTIYKPGQGKYVRVCTFAGAALVTVCGAYVLSKKLYDLGAYLRYGIPTLVTVAVE